MTDISLQFGALLSARAGLQVRAQDHTLVAQTLASRAQHHQTRPSLYLEWLKNGASDDEWKYLFGVLTNQESYFFRDTGQFELLREEILPALIAQNRQSRTLKLWSAGCSTGEEPYSLAMTLDGLMPFRDNWKVQVIATDLSEAALQKARNGVYSAWSFRTTPYDIRDRYFHQSGKDWVLAERLRETVSFEHGNLQYDTFAARGLSDIDLILCRNVFIYFQRQAVASVVQKFRDALRPNGYLMTGHAELHDVEIDDMKARTFAQSVIYQRVSSTRDHQQYHAFQEMPFHNTRDSLFSANAMYQLSKTEATPREAPMRSRSFDTAANDDLRPATQIDEMDVVHRAASKLRAGHATEALELLGVLLCNNSSNIAARFGAQCLAAQHYANNAQYETAFEMCARAIEWDALSPLPYHIQARIEDERGAHERARILLKKVIYLAPQSPVAMIELSAIYQREGDARRARSWHESALKCLIEYSNQDEIEIPQWSLDAPQNVGDVRAHCENALSENALSENALGENALSAKNPAIKNANGQVTTTSRGR